MIRRTALVAAAALALGLPLLSRTLMAETTAMDHSTMHMAGDESDATRAFMEASMKMHGAMDIAYTGNADVDFIAGMIPHHQGAVEAAKIVLHYGTDPEVKAFAEKIIAAQEAEIAWMTDWLAKNGG